MKMIALIVAAAFLIAGARFITSDIISCICAAIGIACAYFAGYLDVEDDSTP